MLITLAAAAALAVGVHPIAVGIMVVAAVQPWWFLAGTALWSVLGRRRAPSPGPDDEARYLEGVASELRAGASPRSAIEAAADRAPSLDLASAVRLAALGRPPGQVAEALAAALPLNGKLAGPAFRLASETGARAADLFADLAVRAAANGDLARERHALTAQARLSALLVGGTPVVVLVLLAVGGRAGALWTSSGGRVIGGAGLALLASGAAVVLAMVKAAER